LLGKRCLPGSYFSSAAAFNGNVTVSFVIPSEAEGSAVLRTCPGNVFAIWRLSLEPWLRGTLTDLPVVQRALLHSLEMAQEDTAKWCGGLDDRELHARPFQLPSVAFQLRHIARSLDRFCCYAEGTPLSEQQFAALASEMDETGTRDSIFSELQESLDKTRQRLPAIIRQPADLPIKIGRKGLPTMLTGLLIHAAEHTQRHVGQAITTAKVIVAQRG
jgi:uncharacterized damage-inducible protein DinB